LGLTHPDCNKEKAMFDWLNPKDGPPDASAVTKRHFEAYLREGDDVSTS
jgi:hypothetical protein